MYSTVYVHLVGLLKKQLLYKICKEYKASQMHAVFTKELSERFLRGLRFSLQCKGEAIRNIE
jgi:hypothetical protein